MIYTKQRNVELLFHEACVWQMPKYVRKTRNYTIQIALRRQHPPFHEYLQWKWTFLFSLHCKLTHNLSRANDKSKSFCLGNHQFLNSYSSSLANLFSFHDLLTGWIYHDNSFDGLNRQDLKSWKTIKVWFVHYRPHFFALFYSVKLWHIWRVPFP